MLIIILSMMQGIYVSSYYILLNIHIKLCKLEKVNIKEKRLGVALACNLIPWEAKAGG